MPYYTRQYLPVILSLTSHPYTYQSSLHSPVILTLTMTVQDSDMCAEIPSQDPIDAVPPLAGGVEVGEMQTRGEGPRCHGKRETEGVRVKESGR